MTTAQVILLLNLPIYLEESSMRCKMDHLCIDQIVMFVVTYRLLARYPTVRYTELGIRRPGAWRQREMKLPFVMKSTLDEHTSSTLGEFLWMN